MTTNKANLPAPKVPEASGNGGLPSQPAEGDSYKVHILVWPDAKPGDTYRLLRNGVKIEFEPTTTGTLLDEKPGSEVTLLLPRILVSGDIILNFEVNRNKQFLHGSDGKRLHITQ